MAIIYNPNKKNLYPAYSAYTYQMQVDHWDICCICTTEKKQTVPWTMS